MDPYLGNQLLRIGLFLLMVFIFAGISAIVRAIYARFRAGQIRSRLESDTDVARHLLVLQQMEARGASVYEQLTYLHHEGFAHDVAETLIQRSRQGRTPAPGA